MVKPKTILIFLTIFSGILGLPKISLAGTIKTASCSQADVQAAINSAQEGDTVMIPEGTCTWTSGVSIGKILTWQPYTFETKSLTLQGAGIDKTVIINNIPDIWGNAITVLTLAGKPERITGLTFKGGSNGTANSHGTISLGGNGKNWRIDHVKFYKLNNGPIEISGSTYGVIDHCAFDIENVGIYIFNDGDTSWASPLSLGTEKAVYIEDNTFSSDAWIDEFVDSYGGARWVFRHNTVKNFGLGCHGSESTGRVRGTFSYEIYNNIFERTMANHLWTVFHARSGTGVLFNNIITGTYDSLAVLGNYRDYHYFDPWGACDGTSPFDVNDGVTYDSGAHTGINAQRVLSVAGKNWTINQWVSYSLHNMTKNKSSVILSNTQDTITTAADDYSAPMTFDTNDSFRILKAYPCLDQVGRSTGSLISGSPPTPQTWPQEALEPFYEWNNTLNGIDGDTGSASPHIKVNRDFYNNTSRPNYTPYVYPHPFITDCVDYPTLCDSPSDTTPPAAPSGATII